MESELAGLPLAQMLWDSNPDGLAYVETQGGIVSANPGLEKMVGLTTAQLAGTPIWLYFTEFDVARNLMFRARANEVVKSVELELRSFDGSTRTVMFDALPVLDDDGSVIGMLTAARDISDFVAAEEQTRFAERYARSLIESSLDPLVTISNDGKIMDVNQATERATGRSREEIIGSDFSDYFTDPARARAGYELVFSQGQVTDYPLQLRHESGSVIDVLYNASVYHNDKGEIAGVFAAARDTTMVKRAQDELRQTNREVTTLSEMSSLMQSCASVNEAVPIVQRTMELLFTGLSGRLMLFDPDTDAMEEVAVWGGADHDERSILPADCWALRRGHIHDVGFIDNLNPPCSFITAGDRPYLCIPLSGQGAVIGVIHLISDGAGSIPHNRIRALAANAGDSISLALGNLRLRETLAALSVHDPLTGLYNRRFMEETLDREVARAARDNDPLSVAMIDLDHFKQVNDTYGHDAGDAVLRQVADLTSGFRQGSDITCRYGGEEFLIVLPGMGVERAVERLDHFRQAVARLVVHHGGEDLPPVTVSVGVSSYPGSGRSAATLVKSADDALYTAKEQGRDRVVAATSS